jgi:hypothetical protein
LENNGIRTHNNNDTTPCRACGSPIKFDSQIRGQNGRVIPLNPDGSRHVCPNSNWKTKTDENFYPTNTSNNINPHGSKIANSDLERMLELLDKREADYEQILMSLHDIHEQTSCLGRINENIEKVINIIAKSDSISSFKSIESNSKEGEAQQENDSQL